MVSFSVDGSTVKIYVDSGTGVNKPFFVFSCQVADEATAQILRIHFADQPPAAQGFPPTPLSSRIFRTRQPAG